MAAATVDYTLVTRHLPEPTLEVQLSALTSGQLEAVSFASFMPKTLPQYVRVEVTTPAASGDQVTWEHDQVNDSATNGTLGMRFRVRAGGDITGAKVRVQMAWKHGAPQDQTSTTTLNT